MVYQFSKLPNPFRITEKILLPIETAHTIYETVQERTCSPLPSLPSFSVASTAQSLKIVSGKAFQSASKGTISAVATVRNELPYIAASGRRHYDLLSDIVAEVSEGVRDELPYTLHAVKQGYMNVEDGLVTSVDIISSSIPQQVKDAPVKAAIATAAVTKDFYTTVRSEVPYLIADGKNVWNVSCEIVDDVLTTVWNEVPYIIDVTVHGWNVASEKVDTVLTSLFTNSGTVLAAIGTVLHAGYEKAKPSLLKVTRFSVDWLVPHKADLYASYERLSDSIAGVRSRLAQLTVIPLVGLLTFATVPTASAMPATRPYNVDGSFQTMVDESQTLTVSEEVTPTSVTRDTISIIDAPPVVRGNLNTGSGRLYGVVPAPAVAPGSILATAFTMQGVPYVSNGARPETGFDCSGFTQWVYAQHGVALPHNSNTQGAMGTPVSEADAQPGDLLIWPGHVAIWVSPGLMIDAAVPGTTIQVHSIWGNPMIVRIG